MFTTTTMAFGDDYSRRMSEIGKAMQQALAPTLRLQQEMGKAMQQALAPTLRLQQEMGKAMQQALAPTLRLQQEMGKAMQQALAPTLQIRQQFAKQIATVLLPSKRIQEQMASLVGQIASARNHALVGFAQSLSERLQDYNPTIEDMGDAIVIDGDTYSQDDIEHALVQDDVITSPSKWESLPKPLQWLLLSILTIILSWIANFVAYGQVPFAHPRHQQKAIVRQAKVESRQHVLEQEQLPFVTKDDLTTHAGSKRKSRVLGHLPFGTEVSILQYRNKKRWLLVEWQDGATTRKGWVLGRYVFRPSKYRKDGR